MMRFAAREAAPNAKLRAIVTPSIVGSRMDTICTDFSLCIARVRPRAVVGATDSPITRCVGDCAQIATRGDSLARILYVHGG